MNVYNPEGFDPRDHLPPHLHAYSDCARVLVHLVETARVFNKLRHSDFVFRKAAYLRRLVHKEMYLPIRDALIKSRVLDWHPHYVKGKQSYGFRIGERFENSLFRRYELTDRAAVRRLQRVRVEQCPILTGHTLMGLRTWLNELELDYEAASSFLRGMGLPNDIFRPRHLSLSMLRDREFFFRPDLHGRVHTNLTNLWGGFRRFLRFDGERLMNIDIGNSQPLFFGIVVSDWISSEKREQRFNNNDLISLPSPSPFHYDAESIKGGISDSRCMEAPDDLKRYLHVTERAQFYEEMMAALDIPLTKLNRDAFKKDFFGKVFYCKANYYTKERKAFQR